MPQLFPSFLGKLGTKDQERGADWDVLSAAFALSAAIGRPTLDLKNLVDGPNGDLVCFFATDAVQGHGRIAGMSVLPFVEPAGFDRCDQVFLHRLKDVGPNDFV